jgi:hypothetical protein
MLSASMLRDYSTSASSTPSCFLRRTNLLGNPFPHHVVTRPTFSSLFFFGSSYRPSCPPRCSDTTLRVHLRCPLNFFIIVSIYWKATSYKSSLDLSSFGKTSNRSAAKLNSFFFLFFGPMCMLFDLSIALRLPHDLSKVAAPTPRSGARGQVPKTRKEDIYKQGIRKCTDMNIPL